MYDLDWRGHARCILPIEILNAMVSEGGTKVTVYVTCMRDSSTWTVRTVYDILQPDKNINVVYNSFEDIPEFIGSKVATLSLLDSWEMLKDVGMRGTGNSYWVIVDRSDAYNESNGLVKRA